MIERKSKIIDDINYIELKNDLINNFKWNNSDDVNITNVMNLFKISSSELFYIMYLAGNPCNMGYFSFDDEKHNDFTLEKAKEVLESHRYHIDWYNGHGIKNSFRKTENEEQTINVRRFDDRNYLGCFYTCILNLIKHKKEHKNLIVKQKKLSLLPLILSVAVTSVAAEIVNIMDDLKHHLMFIYHLKQKLKEKLLKLLKKHMNV
jgi:hypothetical protein